MPGCLQAFFAIPTVLSSEVDYTGRTVNPLTSCSRLLDLPCPYNTSDGFFLGDVLLSRCHGSLHVHREVLILLSFFVVTTPHHRCSVANMARDLLASDGLMPTIWGSRHAAQTALTFIWHVSLQVYRKLVSDVYDLFFVSGSADVVGYEVSPANACGS